MTTVRRAGWRRSARVVGAGLGVLAAAVLPGAAAAASPLACGDVVIDDVTLTEDLYCPGSHGLVIGANGVTLDLDGHSIIGDGATSSVGVYNVGDEGGGNVNNYRVTGGTITGFGIGIQAGFTNDVRIDRLTVSDSRSSGIWLLSAAGAVVERNEIEVAGGPAGILATDGSGLARIQRNWVTGHGGAGIQVVDMSGGAVARNTVVGSFTRAAIELVEGAPPAGGQTDTRIERNTVTSRTGDGIYVGSLFTATTLSRNVATGNGDDGIDVRAGGTLVKDNVARRNADVGIVAIAGTIDGGGNEAAGNGGPAQCVNVSCT